MPEYVPTQAFAEPLEPDDNPYATQPPGTRFQDFQHDSIDPSELETQPPGTKLGQLTSMSGVDPSELITLPPGTKLRDLPGLSPMATTPGLELDLLLLTPEDLLLEVAPSGETELGAEPELDLEELDLDSLRGIPLEPAPAELPDFSVLGFGTLEPAATIENEPFDLTPPSGFTRAPAEAMPTRNTVPAAAPEAAPEPASEASFPMGLPELEDPTGGFHVVTGEVVGVPAHPADAASASAPEAELEPAVKAPTEESSRELPPIQTLDLDAASVPSLEAGLHDWEDVAEPVESSFNPMTAALAAGSVAALAAGSAIALTAGSGTAVGEVAGADMAPHAPAPAAVPLPPLPPVMALDLGDGPEAMLVRAVIANPALMDALARALVARLGDQALREIAWELMPELAEKLHRSS